LKISNLFLLIFLLNLCSQFNELVVKFVIEKQNSKKEDQNEKKWRNHIANLKFAKKGHLSLKFYFVYFLIFKLGEERESC
jgi:hypothetical protein